MSLRNLNLSEPFLDSAGNLANGTISFYVGQTQTLANIYDAAGTQLSQPVTVAAGKPTSSIYLESNVDVRCVPSYDRSFMDMAPTVGIDNQGVDVPSFDTVTDLMAAQGLTDEEVVCLLGYETQGDKPIVYYTYHEDGTYEADYGSIIPCTAAGYFSIIEPETIDVRHWGVFGYNSVEDAHTHAEVSQITLAQSYASAHKKKLYFPDHLFYQIAAGTYDCENGQLFSNGGVVTIKSSTTKIFSNSSYYSTWTISNDLVYASQLNVSTMPTITCKKFVMDTFKPVTLSDCEVYALVNLAYESTTTWDNVKIYGNGIVTSAALRVRASHIDPEILSSNLSTVDIQTIFINCTTNNNLWDDQVKWRAFADVNMQDVVEDSIVSTSLDTGAITSTSISNTGTIYSGGNVTSSALVTGVTLEAGDHIRVNSSVPVGATCNVNQPTHISSPNYFLLNNTGSEQGAYDMDTLITASGATLQAGEFVVLYTNTGSVTVTMRLATVQQATLQMGYAGSAIMLMCVMNTSGYTTWIPLGYGISFS